MPYRFVLADEEAERPRILVWLFRPALRLAYATPAQYALPRAGAVRAAKVLYKLLGPAASAADLAAYVPSRFHWCVVG